MIKIVTVGVMLENNFGSPSILHGIEELVKIFYSEYEITNYQKTQWSDISESDISFETVRYSNNPIRLIWLAVKDRVGLRIKDSTEKKVIQRIKEADIVIDAYGILFCDNLVRIRYNYLSMLKYCIGKFSILFLAKLYRKKSIKAPSSFGPMKSKFNIKSAEFCCKHIFDIICARESASREVLITNTKIKIPILLSPDIANLMRYDVIDNDNGKPIGISVSHQIIRQWGAEEEYIKCIASLCEHIKETYDRPIILIPNELSERKYDDMSVAQDIQSICKNKGLDIDIVDARNLSSTALKSCIASCEVIVASRYHSCVAALSSGVPTLAIGWHYKYQELLHWYGQEKWILSNENCTSEKLKTLFDCLWSNHENEREIIIRKYSEVRNALIEAGKVMFSKDSIKE